MNIKDKASKIRQLKKDPVFQDVLKEIQDRQVSVFLNPDASQDDLAGAHDIIRAFNEVEIYFQSVFAEEMIFDKREKKGQYRVND